MSSVQYSLTVQHCQIQRPVQRPVCTGSLAASIYPAELQPQRQITYCDGTNILVYCIVTVTVLVLY